MGSTSILASFPVKVHKRFGLPGFRKFQRSIKCGRDLMPPNTGILLFTQRCTPVCRATGDSPSPSEVLEEGFISNRVLKVVLWTITGIYVLWLFILPYAPGDPAWAIDAKTLAMLLDLSLNFFLILPLLNAAGFHVIEAPVVHPTSEALFNLVMGWTLLLGPVIFSDKRNNRFKGSLEALWLGQWVLTSTFLAPYMAIRLNPAPQQSLPVSKFRSAVLSGSKYFAAAGALVGVLSVVWGVGGRGPAFGDLNERWRYFTEYVGTDRVGYAFVWDLFVYSVFQPWLIQSNLSNIRSSTMQAAARVLRFVPVLGMAVYLWGLDDQSA